MRVLDQLKMLYKTAADILDGKEKDTTTNRGPRFEDVGIRSLTPNNATILKPMFVPQKSAVGIQGINFPVAPTNQYTQIAPTPLTKEANWLQQFIWGISQWFQEKQVLEETKWLWKIWEKVWQSTRWIGENLVQPFMEILDKHNYRGMWYKENEDRIKDIMNPNVLGNDRDKLEEITKLTDEKNQILNNPTIDDVKKQNDISAIDTSIFEIARTFSKIKDNSQVPDMEFINWMVDSFKRNEINREIKVEEDRKKTPYSFVSPTPTWLSEYMGDIYKKIASWIVSNDLQWRVYRDRNLTFKDAARGVQDVMSTYEISEILSKPYLAKSQAEAALKTLTNPRKIEKAKEIIARQTAAMEHNDQYVIPYVQWMISHLWTDKGSDRWELSKRYFKEKWLTTQQVFWEYNPTYSSEYTDLSKAIMGSMILDWIVNRWDIGQQDLVRARMLTEPLGAKAMDVIGQVSSRFDNTMNSLLWVWYWKRWLGKMDINALKNVDSQIAPPQGVTKQTRESFNNFKRKALQMAPEIITQVVPWLLWEWEIATLQKAWEVAKTARLIDTATETARLVDQWVDLATAAKTATKLSDLLGKSAPAFVKLINSWTDPLEAINLVSKWDYFTKKVLFGPVKNLLINYLQSAGFQWKNPKQYSTTDFWIDTSFWVLDTILSVGKAINHYALDNVKYKDVFLNSFSKDFFDISDTDWVKLNSEDRLLFNKMSEWFLKKYEDMMGKHIPRSDIDNYISKYKEKYGKIDVDEILNHSKTVDPDFDITTLDYQRAKTKNLVPDYVDEDDYNHAIEIFDWDEKATTNFIKDLKTLDQKYRIRWMTSQMKWKEVSEFIDKVVDQHKLAKEPWVTQWLNNFIDDVDDGLWSKWTIEVNGKEYNYQIFDQNMSWKPGVREINWVALKSEWKRFRTSYILLLPWEDVIIHTEWLRNVGYDIIDGAGNKLDKTAAKNRMLSFFKVKDWWIMWWTMARDKQWLSVNTIKNINKEEGLDDLLEQMKSQANDAIVAPNWDIVSYKWINVEKKDPDVLITEWWKPVAAKYMRDQKVIWYSPENMQKKFDEKAWTKAQTEWVTPLPEDQFKTYEEREEFVFEHEYAHDTEPPRNLYNETRWEYEDRINQAALRNIESKKPPVTIQQPSLFQDVKTSVKILDKTKSTLNTASYLDKTHWFSTLNDILKRWNIDNDWFQISKSEYKVNGKNLSVSLKEIFDIQKKANIAWNKAKKWWTFSWGDYLKDPANAAVAQQYTDTIEEVKRFVSDTIDTFFPQDVLVSSDIWFKTLKEKATDKILKDIKLDVQSQRKARNLRITSYYNDISILSKITEDWWLWEFMKFFDKKKFLALRDDPYKYKRYFNVNFPDSDWEKYRKLWKYIGNDTAETKLVKTISVVLWADMYRFWQTVVNIAGVPKLLVMNSLAWLTENMRKYNIMNYTDTELALFRNKYNVLFSADELTNKWLIKDLSQINREWLSNAMAKLRNKIVDLYKAWFYNAADIFYSSTRRNQSIWQALEEVFPHLKWMTDVDNFLSSLSREERIKALTKVHNRWEEILNKATWQYVEFWKWQMAFWWPLNKIKSAIYWTYGLMGAWWTGMMKSSIETIAHALNGTISRSSVGKRYRNILQTKWKIAADEWAMRFLQQGDDFHHLFEKMNLAIMLWFKQDRLIADDDWQQTLTNTIREGMELWMNYSFPIQAFSSNPYGRAVLAFLWWIVDDMESEWILTPWQLWRDNIKAGWITLWKQIVTDMFRRFVIPKTVITAIARSSEGWDFWMSLMDAYRKKTWGFLYYSALDITQNGFDEYMPLTPYSFLQEIFPYTDKYIEDYRDQWWDYTMKKLMADWQTYWDSWLLYNIPFKSDWYKWKMEQFEIDKKKTTEIINQDEYYMLNMSRWELDWSRMWTDAGLYAYNQLTNFWSMQKKFQDPENRLEPLRRKFTFTVDGEEKISYSQQNQEDIFVELLKDALNDWRYDEFINLFNKSTKWNQKAAAQMLAFAEWQSPWAGKELLANIVSWEWYRMLWESDGRVNWSPDKDKSMAIQKYLWETYWDLMYITDKPVWRKNMSLFYLRQAHPDIQKYISSPYGENGLPNKNITFVYEKDPDKDYESKDQVWAQLFAIDMMANIAVAQWDPNGYKMLNAFSAITIPKAIDDKSLAYTGLLLDQVNRSLDYMDKSWQPRETVIPMKSWTIISIYNKLGWDVIKALMNSEHKEVLMDTMRFLHWTTKEIIEYGKEKWAELWFKDEFWTSFENSNYYNSSKFKYGLNDALYDAVKKLSYLYSPYNSYGSKNYWNRYYSRKERDYLVEYGKSVGTWVARISGGWKDRPAEKWEESGRTPVQKWWAARPFAAKKEDPDKPVDFAMMSTLKRRLTRKAIKYDNRRIGESGSKWWLYNVSYKGGDRKRRVSRAKGGDAKRLAEYNKANRQVLKT